MKKTILVITLTSMLAVTSGVVMAQENKKTREVLYDTLHDVKLAKIDSAADYSKFTQAAELQISSNQETIVNLRARKEEPSKAASAAFKEKIMGLERENDDMKQRIAGADQIKTSSWTVFKNNFNRDMKDLDRALRDI
jgi:hypothetical protein